MTARKRGFQFTSHSRIYSAVRDEFRNWLMSARKRARFQIEGVPTVIAAVEGRGVKFRPPCGRRGGGVPFIGSTEFVGAGRDRLREVEEHVAAGDSWL
jgi:hypothetical protein